MSGKGMRRFYRHAAAGQAAGGWSVTLDGRPILTPAKAPLLLPGRALADAIAAEWEAQGEKIEPASMPLMQLAATAIDCTRPARSKILAEIAAYGTTDLVCYRAARPIELRRRQHELWQPLVDWLGERHGVTLIVTTGIMAVPQPPYAAEAYGRILGDMDEFALTALTTLTAAAGSLVVALALAEGRISPQEAGDAVLVEEIQQAEKWGQDPESEHRHAGIRADLASGARFLELLREAD